MPDWQQVWRELFQELFVPTEVVRESLAADGLPGRYVAVVVRFVNSLGHAEDVDYNAPLPPREQEGLIAAALDKVASCAKEAVFLVVVYSDSVRFLRAAALRFAQT